MVGENVQRMVRGLLYAALILAAGGCSVSIPPGDDDGGNGGEGDGAARTLRVAPGSRGGNFAVGKDEAGNEYSFRAREVDGVTVLTEANVALADGGSLKASLDAQGRPVNFRASDNTAADLVYEGDSVRVRLTAPDGTVIGDAGDIDPAAAREETRRRRSEALSKRGPRLQSGFDLSISLSDGLESYEEITLSIFDAEFNPASPLPGSSLADAALLIADIVSLVEIEVVETEVLIEEIVIDVVPPVVQRLAGNTYVLFDAEGFCLEQTDVASRLTFDEDGILLSEFDRHLVFPDVNFGCGGDAGVTINYLSGTPINLTPDDPSVELFVTPIFTATQVDEQERITIERRFLADIGFSVDIFGPATASATQLFDAAFVNGFLNDEGDLLEFDLVLVDLMEQTPIAKLGRLRYRDQNSPTPTRIFDCEVASGVHVSNGIVCPGVVAAGDDFEATFVAGRESDTDLLSFDWYVSGGFGFILDDGFSPSTLVRATGSGLVEVSLVVTDFSSLDIRFEVYTCGVSIGEIAEEPPIGLDLFVDCPVGLNVGESGAFAALGSSLDFPGFSNWFVVGTSNFLVLDPLELETNIVFFEPGKYGVFFQTFDAFGDEILASCDVLVGGVDFDECEALDYYGDGICDLFCLEPDPDCDDFFDVCALNGYYGDGECDDFCAEPDPDCDGTVEDVCELLGYYGDGECDLFCLLPDSDCDEAVFDFCEENGFYGDGFCDAFCLLPDPDCDNGGSDVDICLENGFYGDGECDDFCPFPDPDCLVESDICLENGLYFNGECDDFCPLPDPDCDDGFDFCLEAGFYGDGECDDFCPLPDPDCL